MCSLPVNVLLLLHVIIHILLWVLALLNLRLIDHSLHGLLLVEVIWVVHDLLLNIVLWLLLEAILALIELSWLLWSLFLLHLLVFELSKTTFVAGISECKVLV